MNIRTLIEHLKEEADEARRWRAHRPLPVPEGSSAPRVAILGGRGRNTADAASTQGQPQAPPEPTPVPKVKLRLRPHEAGGIRPGGLAARFGVSRGGDPKTRPQPPD